MHIHIGRVTSQKRYRHFRELAGQLHPLASSGQALDIVSCDGTAARFHPTQALRRMTDVLYEPSIACG